jgi:nucleotidyltransferase substrate binding protein (TIGR01987 family)
MAVSTRRLERALLQLEKAVNLAAALDNSENDLFDVYRDCTVKRFEIAYSLAFAAIRRGLLETRPPSKVDPLSYADLIREAGRDGLLQNQDRWFEYRDRRNETSHNYDVDSANSVYNGAEDFINDARFLVERLKGRFNSDY